MRSEASRSTPGQDARGEHHRRVTRRHVVHALTRGTVALATLPVLDACRGLERADVDGTDADERRDPHLDRTLRDVLHFASLASSSHNVQPWAARVLASDHVLLRIDPRRRLPAVDPDGRELLLSMGAFLENLVLAASTRGRAVAYQVLATTPQALDLLDVRLTPAPPTAYPLARLTARRTVREGYLDRTLAPIDLSALRAAAGGGAMFFPRGSAEARYLVDATVEANRVQAARDPAQEELTHWVRLSDADGRRHRDGLTPASMEMGGLTAFYARHFMQPRSLLTPANRVRAADRARTQAGAGAGWLVLTSSDERVATLVETGRRYERLLLGLRERMLAIHPMSQLLEEAPFAREVGTRLGTRDPVQFVLRVGYVGAYPEPVSLRRPVRWFVQGTGVTAADRAPTP